MTCPICSGRGVVDGGDLRIEHNKGVMLAGRTVQCPHCMGAKQLSVEDSKKRFQPPEGVQP